MKKADELMDARTRKAILHDEFPALTWPGDKPCPVEKGEKIGFVFLRSLAGPVAQVSITITNIKRGKKGEHMAEYSVRDDRPLYLRRTKGYTRVHGDALDQEAPVTDPKVLSEYAATARLSRARRTAEEESEADAARKRERAIRDRLRETLKGLDPANQVALLASIEREIQKAKMKEAA